MVHDHSPFRWDKLFIAFLAFLVWLPIPYASVTLAGRFFAAFVVFLLLAVWIWQYARGWRELPQTVPRLWPVFGLWGLWLAWVALQLVPLPPEWIAALSPQRLTPYLGEVLQAERIFLSVAPGHTLHALLDSSSYAGLFLLTLLLTYRRTHLRWIFYILVLSGTLQAFYGVLMVLSGTEYVFLQEKTSRGVATGTFINRNHFAGYLVMCLSLGIGLLIAQLGEGTMHSWRQFLRNVFAWILSPKMILRLCLVVMVIALVMTHSRMGNTSFFAALLIAGVAGLLLSRHAPRSTLILLTSLVVIDIFIVGTWFGLEKVQQRLEQTRLEHESRDEVGLDTYTYWQNYFWTGSGLATYEQVFPAYQQEWLREFYDHAHNDYLEFAAETGVVGFVLVGGLFLSAGIAAFRAQFHQRSTLCRGIGFGTGMAIVALAIHSSADFNLQIPANAATFTVILALAWIALYFPYHSQIGLRHSIRHPSSMQRLLGAIAALTVCLLLSGISALWWYAESQAAYARRQLTAPRQADIGKVTQALASARRVNPWQPEYIWLQAQAAQLRRDDVRVSAAAHELLSLQPASAIAWANFVAVKHARKEYDTLFKQALAQAWQRGPGFPVVQGILSDAGVSAWPLLGSSEQGIVVEALVRTGQSRDKKFSRAIQARWQASTWRRGICRYAERSKYALAGCGQ